MKKIFVGAVLFFVVLILVGCQKKEDSSEISDQSNVGNLNEYQFRFKEISEEEYNKIPNLNYYNQKDYYQKYMDINFSPEKIKSGFSLPLKNGKKKEFASEDYEFLGKYKELPFFLLKYSLGRYIHQIVLVSQKNGDNISFDGNQEPYLLPNNNGFLFIETSQNANDDKYSDLILIKTTDHKKLVKDWSYTTYGYVLEIKTDKDKLFLKYEFDDRISKPIFIEFSFLKNNKHSLELYLLSSANVNEAIFNYCYSFEGEDESIVKLDKNCVSDRADKEISDYKKEYFAEEISLYKKRIQILTDELEKTFQNYTYEDVKKLKEMGGL